MRVILCVITLIVIGACDTRFKAEILLSQYVADLSRSALLDFSAPNKIMPDALPSARYRQQTLTQFDIGLLDFLSLQQCDVGVVVGKKNSILGKVMPDSQRFLYELDIIRAIESCDIKNDALAAELLSVAQKKRDELPAALGNAIFNGAESEAFFSLSNGFLPLDYTTSEQQLLLDALNRLVNIAESLHGLPDVDAVVFEGDLKVLMDSEYAGRLLYSLAQVTQSLTQVTAQISSLDQSVCGAPIGYLKQQFEVDYVEQIQPYMGRINQGAYLVLPLLDRLVSAVQPLTVDMEHFVNQLSLVHVRSIWRGYQIASQNHAKQWSVLFKQCGVLLAAVS
ncbi:DUF3080 domain-containing protein [Marinomonas sp. IMCC 4694]|nr:DUF3080 domain-containing protein [Marinomonas sp. IMCC 4694]